MDFQPAPLPAYTETDASPRPRPLEKHAERLRTVMSAPEPANSASLPPLRTPARENTEHSFTHDSRFRVHLASHAGRSDSEPIFHNGSHVSGIVELVVKGGLFSAIEGVYVELVGYRREVVGVDSRSTKCTFLRRRHTLWDDSLPKLPKGSNVLSFELEFPKICELVDRSVEPPPTFRAPGYPFFFVYELVCAVKFKSALHADSELVIPIKYVPRKEAGAPSPARALAYETKTPVPGPADDPTGWMSQTVDLSARVFGDRDVQMTCTLSLPLPLEYARGFYIPFHLAATCADDQVLDLLSAQGAFSVVLDRQAILGEKLGQEDNGTLDVVGRGRSWLVGGKRTRPTRCFEGELKVSPQLMQGFSYYPQFSLRYSVHLRIEAPSLVFLGKRSGRSLLRIPVEITYLPAPSSPKPISYALPLRPGEKEESLYIKPMPPLMFASIGD